MISFAALILHNHLEGDTETLLKGCGGEINFLKSIVQKRMSFKLTASINLFLCRRSRNLWLSDRNNCGFLSVSLRKLKFFNFSLFR